MADTKPAARVDIWPVSAAIWRNQMAEGKIFYSVTFQRSYRDRDGKVANSDSFDAGELLLLAKVADQAHTKIHELRAADRATQKQHDAGEGDVSSQY
jgi:hypothetical protein